jgi:hypothetical protein
LDEAIELALSGERITNSSATTLQQVITAVSTYRALQKEICNAKDMVSGKFKILGLRFFSPRGFSHNLVITCKIILPIGGVGFSGGDQRLGQEESTRETEGLCTGAGSDASG